MSGQPTIAERLARWLLLACTALGLAALHTIGHAAVSPQRVLHLPVAAFEASTAAAGPPVAVTQDDARCGGDGCTHDALASRDTDDSLPWLEVCVAALTALIIAALFAGRLVPIPPGLVGSCDARRRRPLRTCHRLAGLSVTATAVIRV